MIRLLLLGVFFYLIYRFIKRELSHFLQPRDPEAYRGSSSNDQGAELIQDPQCGTYFAKHEGVRLSIRGRTRHFCSPACRDAFVEKMKTQSKKP